ncbi:hypothetical protein HMPREF0198_0997 [Cardiobacterium hominis ATCC 15826]|uniref:Uncharacterized protein n=1 Tax=Cardiobacterium hominis (strain ATCC 15826 / DSM 8339 / NCTC 10426 / 6573) TaxID=638300 RepID=C8N919_CARH6|nr:hypothetical protein HMPREF0198_0997 [Cardiobacterium hominis ATCC 15826]
MKFRLYLVAELENFLDWFFKEVDILTQFKELFLLLSEKWQRRLLKIPALMGAV